MFSLVQRSLAAAATLFVLALPGSAWSAVSFTGSFGLSGAGLTAAGLDVDANRTAGALGFSLEVGETFQTQLFSLWTRETSLEADDLAAQALRVRFDFAGLGGGAVKGASAGGSSLGGLLQYGQALWKKPLILTFGATRLSVTLADAMFNSGAGGLVPGRAAGDGVVARFTLLAAGPSPSPVPLPASAGLLAAGLGAGGLALALRRRRRDGALA